MLASSKDSFIEFLVCAKLKSLSLLFVGGDCFLGFSGVFCSSHGFFNWYLKEACL